MTCRDLPLRPPHTHTSRRREAQEAKDAELARRLAVRYSHDLCSHDVCGGVLQAPWVVHRAACSPAAGDGVATDQAKHAAAPPGKAAAAGGAGAPAQPDRSGAGSPVSVCSVHSTSDSDVVPAEGQWRCSLCTCLNDRQWLRCTACDFVKWTAVGAAAAGNTPMSSRARQRQHAVNRMFGKAVG